MKHQANRQANDLKNKLAEVGFGSDMRVSSGYWVVTIWKKSNPDIAAKAAGMTPMSATLAAALELIKNHL